MLDVNDNNCFKAKYSELALTDLFVSSTAKGESNTAADGKLSFVGCNTKFSILHKKAELFGQSINLALKISVLLTHWTMLKKHQVARLFTVIPT